MTTFILKIIAVICMFIDHIDIAFVSRETMKTFYDLLRCIGRIAFPLYCFFLTEGFKHTHSRLHYFARLVLFAFISQPFYNLFHGVKLLSFSESNVIFTFVCGFVLLWLIDYVKDKALFLKIAVAYACFGIIAVFGFAYPVMYNAYGLLLIISLYFFNKDNKATILIPLCTMLITTFIYTKNYYSWTQWAAIVSLALILFYNGKPGKKTGIAFYFIYPVHFLLLNLLKNLLA